VTLPEVHGGGAFDAESWFVFFHRAAEFHAARWGLDDAAGDIAQQAFVILWERLKAEGREFQADEARRLVQSLASAERHARDVERKHLSLLRRGSEADRTAEPCPSLASLASALARPAELERRLLVAAWSAARLPGVLLDGQFRLFDLVWIAGIPLGKLPRLLGASARAVDERLGRVSDRLDERLIDDLRSAMPNAKWDEMRLFIDANGHRPPSRAVAEAAHSGLGRVIHSHALLLGIG